MFKKIRKSIITDLLVLRTKSQNFKISMNVVVNQISFFILIKIVVINEHFLARPKSQFTLQFFTASIFKILTQWEPLRVHAPSKMKMVEKKLIIKSLNTILNPTQNQIQIQKYHQKTHSFTSKTIRSFLVLSQLLKYLSLQFHVPAEMGVKSKFKWIMQNKWTYPVSIKDKQPEQIMRRSFQEKMEWFRLKLEDRKVSWMEGSESIKIDRTNILQSSLEQLQKLHVTKELKVSFSDEQGENDAGGIFRQWLNLCMKEICQKQFGLLNLCETSQTYYKLNMSEKTVLANKGIQIAELLGYLIAKALMQRVPLMCHLNHTIWRQILMQRITIDDIYSYDQNFWRGWKSILNTEGVADNLFLNYTAQFKDPLTQRNKTFNLIPNGDMTLVTQQNKEDYILKLIDFYCVKKTSKAVEALKKKLFEIIPFKYLKVFEPHEIDCLLCGQEEINVDDWKTNTVYEGYKENDVVVEWFWRVMYRLEHKMLRNMLHYCTGCSRLPVTGFKFLESNRGQVKRFTLRKIPYNQGNPYPQSYTCFNRLELPEYSSFEELQTRVYTVCSEEITEINKDA